MIAPSPLAAALGASLLLHGAAFAVLDQMPRGWQPGALSASHAGGGSLRVLLRAAAPLTAESPPNPGAEQFSPPLAALPTRTAGNGDDPQSPQKIAEPGSAAERALGVFAAPLYYPAGELDERPLIRVHVEPGFPRGAPVPEGRVVLRLYIDEAGSVKEVAVISSEPKGVFEAPAAEAFAAALFTPGRKAGTAVRSQMTIEVLFGAPVPLADSTAGQEKNR